MISPSSELETTPPVARSVFIRTAPFIVVGVLLLAIAGSLVFAAERRASFEGRIYPGIFIEDTAVGGLRPEDATRTLKEATQRSMESGLIVQMGTTTQTIPSSELQKFAQYDHQASVREAFDLGREQSTLQSLFAILGLSLYHHTVNLPVVIDQPSLMQWLRTATTPLLPAAKNAHLVIDIPSTTSSLVRIEPEEMGQTALLEPAVQEFIRQAEQRQFHSIQLAVQPLEPAIRRGDLEPLQTRATAWLARAPFPITLDKRTWSVTPAMVASWITATSSPAIDVALDTNRLAQDLMPWIADDLRPSQEGKLELGPQNTLKTFIAPKEGIVLDVRATTLNVQRVLENSSSTAAIVLTHETPIIQGAEAMGIREVLGIGTSNFSGSPSNRRKNIALGAKHVNGSLIAPDGEFSLLKTLGAIDGAHGWFPELVIKGNKTTPEFGGGLCQIGTTIFRAAMDSGLIITERRNHSYRVRYYEPAGTDATIYDPAPDFRFKNDTGHWILVTTEVRGDNLLFTVWGTKDGRVVAPIKPIISNIVPPPPKKIIPTTDLAVGQTKCTEVAHAGATARLDYNVTYPTGEVKKTVFSSYYKPWGAVCLVGAVKDAPPAVGVDETGINNPN